MKTILQNSPKKSFLKTEFNRIKQITKKFINPFIQIRNHCKTIHNKILQININDYNFKEGGNTQFKNPYLACFLWLIEIVLYGAMISIIYVWIITQNHWLIIPALGLMHWFILNMIGDISNKIKKGN